MEFFTLPFNCLFVLEFLVVQKIILGRNTTYAKTGQFFCNNKVPRQLNPKNNKTFLLGKRGAEVETK
jgi:hypothetical protein